MTSTVRWVSCVQHLMLLFPHGVRFVEMGPRPVLTNLMEQIQPRLECHFVGNAARLNKFLARLESMVLP